MRLLAYARVPPAAATSTGAQHTPWASASCRSSCVRVRVRVYVRVRVRVHVLYVCVCVCVCVFVCVCTGVCAQVRTCVRALHDAARAVWVRCVGTLRCVSTLCGYAVGVRCAVWVRCVGKLCCVGTLRCVRACVNKQVCKQVRK